MSDELIVTVWLDEDLGLSVQKSVMKGSAVAALKDELCKDDPTGGTRQEYFALFAVGASLAEPLSDTTILCEGLLNLAIREISCASRETSASGIVQQDCLSTGVREEDEQVGLCNHIADCTEASMEPTANSERHEGVVVTIIDVLDDTEPNHTVAIRVIQQLQEPRHYEVVHKRVAVRSRPSVDGRVRGALSLGHLFTALPFSILDAGGDTWLHLAWSECWRNTRLVKFEDAEGQKFGGWVLMNGDKIGLGQLVRETSKSTEIAREREATLDKQWLLEKGKQMQSTKAALNHSEDEDYQAEVALGTVSPVSTQVPGYFVTQGCLFKRPGIDPATSKLIQLERPVGSQVCTTGETWIGPQGGEWVELDSSAEKPGWMLIEGPDFGVTGPLLRRIDPGQEKPLVLWAAKPVVGVRDESNLQAKRFLVHPTDTIRDVKGWLHVLFGCKVRCLIVSGPIRDRGDHTLHEYYNLQSESFLKDSITVTQSGYSSEDEVQYVYTGDFDALGHE